MISLETNFWLGEQLNKPAFRVRGSFHHLVGEDLPVRDAFVEARVAANDFEALSNLQGLGFVVVDCNLTLQLAADGLVGQAVSAKRPFKIRFATSQDELDVRRLAYESFEQNRFHRDPCIPDSVASKIKEVWAGNFFLGKRGDWMVVVEDAHGLCGFLQLIEGDDNCLVIDLLAVSARCRRRGFACAMISYAHQNCLGGAANIRVGTQIGNSPSLRLYQAMGFELQSAAYLLHKHV